MGLTPRHYILWHPKRELDRRTGEGFRLARSIGRHIVILAVSAIAVAGAATADALAVEVSPLIVSTYRTPNDWGLTPAGQQVDTRRTPDGVAVSPDGKTVFALANSQLDNALTTIDASTLLASPTETSATYFGAAADSSYGWALSPARKVLYVTNMADQTSNAATGTVSVVNIATPGEIQRVKVGKDPLGIAVSPDGSRVVVANSADDTITVLLADSHGKLKVAHTYPVRAYKGQPRGATPTAVAYSPDGSLL